MKLASRKGMNIPWFSLQLIYKYKESIEWTFTHNFVFDWLQSCVQIFELRDNNMATPNLAKSNLDTIWGSVDDSLCYATGILAFEICH